MALIKCSNCGKEISSNAETCIHCGNTIAKERRTQPNIMSTDFETEKNITALNMFSNLLKWLMLIGGIIFIVLGCTTADDIGALFFIVGVISIIFAFIVPTFIKWKALLLKNIYELNMKGGK